MHASGLGTFANVPKEMADGRRPTAYIVAPRINLGPRVLRKKAPKIFLRGVLTASHLAIAEVPFALHG